MATPGEPAESDPAGRQAALIPHSRKRSPSRLFLAFLGFALGTAGFLLVTWPLILLGEAMIVAVVAANRRLYRRPAVAFVVVGFMLGLAWLFYWGVSTSR